MVTIKKKLLYNGLIAFVINAVMFFALSLNLYLGLAVLLVIFLGLVKNTRLFFNFFIQAVFFQNMFIAFFSGIIDSESHFKILHGINFLLPLLLSVLVFKNSSDYFDRTFFSKTIVIVVILAGHFIYGIMGYGFLNSAQYLRLFLVPILFLLTGIYFSKKSENEFYDQSIKTIFIICCIVTFLQLIMPFLTSFLLNDLAYFKLKWGVTDWDELLSRFKSKRLFNISWFDIRLSRIGSLIKSIISLGYFLTIMGIYFYMPKKKISLFLVILLVILAVNSKGAILVFIFSSILYFLFYRTNLSKGLAMSMYIFFNVIFVLLGYLSRNEHIVGFFSGGNYLFTIGNGLGFGGNLSSSLVADHNGTPLPDLGYWTRFQNGSESVYGVLFSSLGVFSLYYIYYFLEIVVMLYKKFKSNLSQARILRVLALVLLIQGIYQEEAYSPYAFGLVMFLVGLNFKKIHEKRGVI